MHSHLHLRPLVEMRCMKPSRDGHELTGAGSKLHQAQRALNGCNSVLRVMKNDQRYLQLRHDLRQGIAHGGDGRRRGSFQLHGKTQGGTNPVRSVHVKNLRVDLVGEQHLAFEFWHQHLRQVHVSERRDALHHTDKGLPSAERHVSLQEWSEQHQDRRTVGGGLQAQGSCQSDPTPQTVPTNGKLSSLHISQDLRWAQVVGLGGCLLGGVNQLNQLHKIVHQMGVLVDHTALSTRVTMPFLVIGKHDQV
mmetsp:Transcript_58352/g.127635  ORF Transcript_58352/g.127635 Transcript_58352/m.127635 type:complete len:249 (-) Transcript_58352:319-1065(-)